MRICECVPVHVWFFSGQYEIEAIELCLYNVQKKNVDCIQCNNVRYNRCCSFDGQVPNKEFLK